MSRRILLSLDARKRNQGTLSNASFYLSDPIFNVRRVAVAHVQYYNTINNITSTCNRLVFRAVLPNALGTASFTYTITAVVPQGIYTLRTLATALQTTMRDAIQATFPDVLPAYVSEFQISVDENTGIYIFHWRSAGSPYIPEVLYDQSTLTNLFLIYRDDDNDRWFTGIVNIADRIRFLEFHSNALAPDYIYKSDSRPNLVALVPNSAPAFQQVEFTPTGNMASSGFQYRTPRMLNEIDISVRLYTGEQAELNDVPYTIILALDVDDV